MRFVLALIACCVLAATARAEDREAARIAFRTADSAYKAQNFEAALHHYEEAYKHLPLPEIAFSAAQAYRKQYRIDPKVAYVVRAIELYEVYLAKVKTGGRVSDASDNLGEMKIELVQLQARGIAITPATPPAVAGTWLAISPRVGRPSDQVIEVSELRGASDPVFQVTIDGKQVPAFVPVEVSEGPHVVRVETPGYVPSELRAHAMKNVSTIAEVVLVPRPGMLAIETEPGAEITVDGRARGRSPVDPLALPAGSHLLAITRRGRQPVVKEVTLERGATLALREPLDKTTQRRTARYVAIGAGSVAVLTVASFVIAKVQDVRAENRLDEINAGDASVALADRYDDFVRSRDRFRTIGWITAGSAVAAGLAAAGLYWFDTPRPERARIRPTGLGVSFDARF